MRQTHPKDPLPEADRRSEGRWRSVSSMAIPQATASAKKTEAAPPHSHRRVWNDKHYRWVPTADGDWRVQGYIFHHKHRPPKHHFRGPGPKPATARRRRSSTWIPPGGRLPGPVRARRRRCGCWTGRGSAAVPGQADQLASLGLVGAVQSLTRPSGGATLSGPAPVDDEGNPIAPADAWGHDHLWWLDRMVRTNQPLVERMALVFHDWFATSDAGVSKAQQMIDQSNLFRAACFGSFLDLFKAVTVDPAMLQWLNGAENTQVGPERELRPRDDGAVLPRRRPRRLHRGRHPRTGAGADRLAQRLVERTRRLQLPLRPETPRQQGRRRSSARTGNWGWEDACRLCVENPLHPSFFVAKLWSYFVPQPPSDSGPRTH